MFVYSKKQTKLCVGKVSQFGVQAGESRAAIVS